MNTNSIEFTNKDLFKLIWPLVLEQLLSITVGLADSIMVAQVGDASVSAVSLVDSISMLMLYLFSAMAAGGAAVCGQYIGRKKDEDARQAAQHLVVLLFIISASIMILLYVFRVVIVSRLFGQIDADVMAATNTYYTIVMGSVPAIALYNGGTAIFRIINRTDITLKVSLIMNGINVAGNAIMIFALHRGVEGVAYPTLVSRWVAAFIILGLLFTNKYQLSLAGFRVFKFNHRIMKNIVKIGVPGGVENGMFQLGKIVLFSFISTMGTASITANAIGGTIAQLQLFQGFAVNLALTTIISKCVGAGAYDRAKYYLKKLIILAYAFTLIINIIIYLLIPVILNLYGVSEEASELARTIMIMHGISSVVLWVPSFMMPNFLRAAGDSIYTMIVGAASMWIGRVLCAFLLGGYFGLGVIGVWIAHTVIDWFTRAVFFFVRYRRGKWMTKAIKD